MILTGRSKDAEQNTADKVMWKKKFALTPAVISISSEGIEKSVWLECYETRTYYEKGHGWWKENRLIGSTEAVKSDGNNYDSF